MNFRGRRFQVDKANGKIAGVCAGLGETLGVDATVVRIGFVLAALVGHAFFAMLIIYAALAWIGTERRSCRRAPARVETKPRSDGALDERLRAHEQRMREIDTFVAGSNSRLARDIEELRN